MASQALKIGPEKKTPQARSTNRQRILANGLSLKVWKGRASALSLIYFGKSGAAQSGPLKKTGSGRKKHSRSAADFSRDSLLVAYFLGKLG